MECGIADKRNYEGVAVGRLLAYGAFVWGAYSVAQILINGVVLDEVIEPAQIIAGAVRYPDGHPHQIYYPKAYNLFYYLAAGLWAIEPAPLLISAARNFLFLFVSVFVPFALTLLLTRRALWGYLAGALTLTGTALPFHGVYPMWVFPSGHSSGHLGLYAAMLVVVLLLARSWKAGGLLLGLLPALHPAMPILIWPWSGAYLLFSGGLHQRKDRIQFLLAAGLGLAVCAALALLIFSQAQPEAVAPYQVQAEGELIHRQFTLTTDVHRALPRLQSFGYLIGPVALFTIGLLLWRAPKRLKRKEAADYDRQTCFWLLVLSGMVALYVYGAWLLQFLMGPLPEPVEMAMPFRFSNFWALLLAPFTVAAVAYTQEAMTGRTRRLAMVALAMLVFVAGIGLLKPQIANHMLFVVWGLFFASDLYVHREQPRRGLAAVAAALAIGAAAWPLRDWSPVIFSFLISFLIGCLAFSLSLLKRKQGRVQEEEDQRTEPEETVKPREIGWAQTALSLACLVVSLAALPRSSNDAVFRTLPRWDMISPFDRELDQWLAMRAKPDEMILPAIMPRTKLQPKTNHPVLFELESLWLMGYMPSLSPVIGTMTRDLHGIDYTDQDQLNRICRNGHLSMYWDVWLEAWKQRKRNEWQALGRKYGFRLVLSPNNTPLDLPVALPGPFWSLYEIQ